jgi:hypothetical protein
MCTVYIIKARKVPLPSLHSHRHFLTFFSPFHSLSHSPNYSLTHSFHLLSLTPFTHQFPHSLILFTSSFAHLILLSSFPALTYSLIQLINQSTPPSLPDSLHVFTHSMYLLIHSLHLITPKLNHSCAHSFPTFTLSLISFTQPLLSFPSLPHSQQSLILCPYSPHTLTPFTNSLSSTNSSIQSLIPFSRSFITFTHSFLLITYSSFHSLLHPFSEPTVLTPVTFSLHSLPIL